MIFVIAPFIVPVKEKEEEAGRPAAALPRFSTDVSVCFTVHR